MIKFSLILNSRGRSNLLKNLLESIKNTTSNLDEIEVLISCDDDDLETLWLLENSEYRFIKVEYIERDRNLHRRINRLANVADGEFIWILNDDVEIITKNWDSLCYSLINIYSNSIIYCRTSCDSVDKEGHAQYSSFPMLSKISVNKLGFFMPDFIVGLGGDVVLYRIFEDSNKIIDLPIQVKHILHQTIQQVVNPDLTAAEMRQNTYSNPVDFWNVDVSEYKKLI